MMNFACTTLIVTRIQNKNSIPESKNVNGIKHLAQLLKGYNITCTLIRHNTIIRNTPPPFPLPPLTPPTHALLLFLLVIINHRLAFMPLR
jgi:hypothetical protein